MYTPTYRSACVKIKLKAGTVDQMLARKNELTTRREETKQTLIDEGVFWEAVFWDKQGEENYLIMVVKYESDQKLDEAVKKSQHAIDQYHRQFKKDTWETRTALETVLDLENFPF